MAVLAALIAVLVLVLIPFLLFTPRAPRAPARCDSPGALRTYLQTLTDHETPPALGATVMRDGRVEFALTRLVAQVFTSSSSR